MVTGDGVLVEEGEAAQTAASPEWIYTAKVANTATACKVTVTALDRSGHAGTMEKSH